MPEPTAPTLSYRFARFTFGVFFRIWFRWKVLHRERVPAEGGVILASNHVSYLDPVYVVSALERMVVGLARESAFNVPLGGRILTLPFLFLMIIAAVGIYFMAQRFIHGMGAVANINGGFPWGIWVVYDVVIGTGLACGGYALAFTVYVFNKGKYHPLVRPALLASLLGYALGGFSAIFDMGRWWQFYNILLPWHMNFNSVMLEIESL